MAHQNQLSHTDLGELFTPKNLRTKGVPTKENFT
jgi:hypothetical protein